MIDMSESLPRGGAEQWDGVRAVAFRDERLRVVGELAVGVVHDVNNALGAIRQRLFLLRGARRAEATDDALLLGIEQSVQQAIDLVARVQTLGRDDDEEEVRPVDLAAVVDGAIRTASGALRAPGGPRRRLAITSDLCGLPDVLGDPDALRWVFVNLLLNARDAMPAGGEVAIRARLRPRRVEVFVEDTGPGIAPEHLPRLFDLFFTTKGERGSGIGLAIAKRVMERAGGAIRARNRPEGGACFELTFRRA
jgi:signal transduction histidine kinase